MLIEVQEKSLIDKIIKENRKKTCNDVEYMIY